MKLSGHHLLSFGDGNEKSDQLQDESTVLGLRVRVVVVFAAVVFSRAMVEVAKLTAVLKESGWILSGIGKVWSAKLNSVVS